MTGVAIVAVPNKTDLVWDISSEKIPHMTLLYLGDALAKEDYRHVQEFVTHVADTMLGRFGMGVDKRGTLGDDDADVLFFRNTENSSISLFRKYLLQDAKIREAYDSVEQFDGWTPHLTLGYPKTPAKKGTRENSEFYWVSFDRLMIWTGEYEGPEIELKDEDMALAMSNLDELDAFLAHFGVKGMRWGVRKDQPMVSGGMSPFGPQHKMSKETQTWAKSIATPENIDKLVKDSKPGYLRDLKKINAKYGGKITKETEHAYNSEVYAATLNNIDRSAKKLFGTSPDGTTRIGAMVDPSGREMLVFPAPAKANLRVESIAQAGFNPGSFIARIQLVIDDKGLFTGEMKFLDIEGGEIVQSNFDATEEFLAHFGVKGMRWGVRKSREERRAERTLKVQERAVKQIEKQEQYTARAKAREAAAKAKTEAQDARSAAATAKLEAKLAKDQTRFARKEARSGRDDPLNDVVRDDKGNPRDINGLVGKNNRDAEKQRINASKDVRTLDDATLKTYTQRLDTEKKLKNAINEDLKPGRTAAKKLIGDSGKELAKKALVGAGSMAIFYVISKKSNTHDFKIDPEGLGGLLSGKGKTSGSDAFTKVDKMVELAGGLEIPMSEVAKWKKPPSMGPKATPF